MAIGTVKWFNAMKGFGFIALNHFTATILVAEPMPRNGVIRT